MNSEIHHSSIGIDLWLPRRWWLWLLALPVAAVMAFAIFQPIRVLPRIGIAPAYSFVDQAGKKFTSEDARGALTLYTFSDSRCTAPCRSTSATLAAMQNELSGVAQQGAIPLNFITIFVDPGAKRATGAPAVDAATWHLLTGDSEEVKEVVGAGFDTYYGPDVGTDDNTGAQGRFRVDPVFVLVDGWGIVRAVYRTATPDSAILKRDLSLVIQEIRNSTGVNHYAYEAAHLFLCYPK
jgi:protein SCO1/2